MDVPLLTGPCRPPLGELTVGHDMGGCIEIDRLGHILDEFLIIRTHTSQSDI